MRKSGTYLPHQPEDPKGWDVNESCIQSDIAEIISKMYTPVQSQPIVPVFGEPSYEVLKKTEREFSRGIVYSEDENPQKVFGFHFQTVSTRENNVTIKVDSSESDSTSYQYARTKLKNSRTVCECCRRKVWTSIPKKRTRCECGNYKMSKSHKCLKSHQIEGKSSFVNKDIRGITRKNVCDQDCNIQKCCKSSPSLIPCERLHPIQENNTTPKQHRCDGHTVSFREELQVVPDTEVHICEPSNLKVISDEKQDIKSSSKSVVHRLFCHVSLIFRKTFMQHSSQTPDGNFGNLQSYSKSEKSRLKEVLTHNEGLPKLRSNIPKRIKFKRGFHSLPNYKQTGTIMHGDSEYPKKTEKENHESNLNLEKYASNFSTKHQDDGYEWRRFTIQSSSEDNTCCDTKRKFNYERIDDAHVFDLKEETDEVDKLKFHTFPLLQEHAQFVCSSCKNANHDPRTKIYYHPLQAQTMMVDDWAKQFWARVFAPFHVVTAFFSAFVLQLLSFFLHSLVEPLVWGTLQIVSDYFFQPCLKILFDGILEPIFIILKNIATSVRDLCLPIAECFGHFCRETSHICKACRLFEVHNNYNRSKDLEIP